MNIIYSYYISMIGYILQQINYIKLINWSLLLLVTISSSTAFAGIFSETNNYNYNYYNANEIVARAWVHVV